MNIKPIEEKLKSYSVLKIEIENLKIDLEDYCPSYSTGSLYAGGSKSSNPLPGRVSARPVSSLVESLVIGFNTDTDVKYYRLKECEKIVSKIDNILNNLSDRDRLLIEGFYIKNRTLLELSLELNMNQDYLSAVKRNVLERFFYTLA